MAQHNKTLGRFNLDGIAPAPRGVPQIEVTFDIDANGIVHVSAKDLGTNREQHITITASTNLTEDEIQKAVKEAERFASEDKAKKEEIDTRNAADSAVYQAEKTLKDVGDKLDAEEKSAIESAIEKLRKSMSANDIQAMKDDTEALQQAFFKASEKLYQQHGDAGHTGGPQDFGGSTDGSDQAGFDGDFKDAGGD